MANYIALPTLGTIIVMIVAGQLGLLFFPDICMSWNDYFYSNDFLLNALAACLALTLISGPLGCFILWRRIAYFGDATSHTALLGVALALLFDVPILLGVVVVAIICAFFVAHLTNRMLHSADSLLGIVAHTALAFGIVAVGLMPNVRIDLESLLFGDVLAVSQGEVAAIWVGSIIILFLIWLLWKQMLNATLSEELSTAEGYNPRIAWLFTVLITACVIAISMRVVGLLLASAMLILPASAARPLARRPESMALIAIAVGAVGSSLGLFGAVWLDTQAGPTIVITLFLLFLATLPFGRS